MGKASIQRAGEGMGSKSCHPKNAMVKLNARKYQSLGSLELGPWGDQHSPGRGPVELRVFGMGVGWNGESGSVDQTVAPTVSK